jgi:L-rhamnose mutarotase
MQRRGFLLRLKLDRIDDYLAAHDVWPDMLDAIRKAGIENYSLFLHRDTGLIFGYFEGENPDRAIRTLGKTKINAEWEEHMAKYFEGAGGDLETGGIAWLDEYFHIG